jgi:hypothetical protein
VSCRQAGSCALAISDGITVSTQDIPAIPVRAGWKTLSLEHGIKAIEFRP